MSNILGPFDQLDFVTMKRLKDTIASYKKEDRTKYKRAIDKYSNILKFYMTKQAA